MKEKTKNQMVLALTRFILNNNVDKKYIKRLYKSMQTSKEIIYKKREDKFNEDIDEKIKMNQNIEKEINKWNKQQTEFIEESEELEEINLFDYEEMEKGQYAKQN